jgi:hypothetical protein
MRELNPNDEPETFVIELDTPIEMVAAYGDATEILSHVDTGDFFRWTMELKSEGQS